MVDGTTAPASLKRFCDLSGVRPGELNIFLAGDGTGKSVFTHYKTPEKPDDTQAGTVPQDAL